MDCGDYGLDIRISTGAANMKLGDCVPTALDADLVAVSAAVHHTLGQVGALLLFHLHDLANDHLADACIQRDQLFHLKAAGEQLLLQLLSGNVDINEFF